MSVLQSEVSLDGWKKYMVLALAIGIVIFFVSQSIAIIPAGHRGVFLVWGAVDETRSVDEGLTFKLPIANEILPIEVVDEIIKEPEKSIIQKLIDDKKITKITINVNKRKMIENANIGLHLGECACITYAMDNIESKIISDDRKARKKFKNLNFVWTEELLDNMKEDEMISDKKHTKKLELLDKSPFYSKRLKN